MPVDRLTGGRVGQPFSYGSPTRPLWASYSTNRKPNFKTHKTKGMAMGALSNQMPGAAIQILHWDEKQNEWIVYIDFVPPKACERCGGPFAFGTYPGDYRNMQAENRYDDKRPMWERDIVCNVCKVADKIEDYMELQTFHSLPYGIGQSPALNRLIEIAPEFKDKWNWCVDQHHEYKKRAGKI